RRGRPGGAAADTDQRPPLRDTRRRVPRGPGARPGLRRAGAGRLGEHQRLDQPVGVAPAVRRAVRLGERARPGRRALCDGDLHRAEDDRLPRSPTQHVNSRQSQPRAPGTDGAGYLDIRVGEVLDALAAARPDPGGGSAAALAVALAAALCAMTAELSARHLAQAPRLAADSRELLRRAAPLAQADADAYGGVLAARRAPGPPAGRPRAERVSAALARASGLPPEVAQP